LEILLDFRILGPFEVVDGDRELAMGGPQQRALLALLVLHRDEVVSSDRLIEELWAGRPPATAGKIVQGYVSHLRKVLGDDVLLTRSGGYRLAAGPEQVDAERFTQLVGDGRRSLAAGNASGAQDLLSSALSLWRGEPLADLAYEQFAREAISRLQEERLAALEDRIDADLSLGGHHDLVAELESLSRRHPNRERLLGQLMLSLYCCGRQSDALDAYRRGRQSLRDELGLEPGPELRTLEQRILDQDPAFDQPARSPPAAAARDLVAPQPAAGRAVRGKWLLGGGGGLLLAAAIAATIAELAGGHGVTVRVAANSVAGIDVRSNRVTAAATVGARPSAITYGAGSLWVANLDDQTISRVDPRTLQTLRTISLDEPPTGITAVGGAIWAVMSNPTEDFVTASRIDPQFNSVDRAVRVGNVDPATAPAIAAQGNSLWVAPQSGDLTRLSSVTADVVQRIDPNASPSGLALGAGAMWLTDNEADNVVRVDPTGLKTTIPVGHAPNGIAVDDGSVWVADTGDNRVVRIDSGTQAVTTTIPVGEAPLGVAVGAGSVWVANSGNGTVSRIDPRTNRVTSTIEVGGSPQAIVVASGRAWVTVDASAFPRTAAAREGGTLRVDSAYAVSTLDTAIAYDPLSWQVLYATCAELVNYPDRSGTAGSQLVPEVAQSLPAVSPDGRTYTFTIRKDFRFAQPSDQPVTAQTFKDTIERTLNPAMKSPVASEFDDIVGTRAYMAGTADHISGVVASGDTLTIRLTARAPDFLARMAQPFFCAVPPDTPINPNGVAVIPSAGPYSVASDVPDQGIVLVRNPNYHGNRPHHFQRIEVYEDVPGQRAVTAVEAGTADYAASGEVAASEAKMLAVRYGPHSRAARSRHQQYFVNAESELDFFALNTHRPLFSSERLREAVNYAINRKALARLGDSFAAIPEQPFDHYLPPGIPGYRDINVYPAKPDLAKARRLAKGYAGATVVLYTCDNSPCIQQAQIVRTDLSAIGLRLVVKTFGISALYSRYLNPGEPFDMADVTWEADYPDPDNFLNLLLEGGSIVPTFEDPGLRDKLAKVAQLSGVDRYLAYGRLDQEIAVKVAPFVAFGNASSHDLFSRRVGCQTFSLVYGMDLAALCVRPDRRPQAPR
jgi:YVTN family beta-propeller protein